MTRQECLAATRVVAAPAGPVVLLPLDGGGVIKLDAADLQPLLDRGLDLPWFLVPKPPLFKGWRPASYVMARNPAEGAWFVRVARAIHEAGPEHVVHYHNGDRTDLRRANIWREVGRTVRKG